jgi:hypothetical protein
MIDICLTLTRQLWGLVLDPSIVGDAPGPASWLPSSLRMLFESSANVAELLWRVQMGLLIETHAPTPWWVSAIAGEAGMHLLGKKRAQALHLFACHHQL